MIRIGICDDENAFRSSLRKLCETHLQQIGQRYEIIEFTSGEELLAHKEISIDLLYLDVEMGELNGIEVMHKLLDRDNVWKIVFVTNYDSTVWDAFNLKTLGFIRKNIDNPKIILYLQTIINELEANKHITINENGEHINIFMKDFLYLSAAGHYTDIYTLSDKYRMWGNLKFWESRMVVFPLVRIHKSLVVNMHQIQKVYNNRIVLLNKTELAMGNKYQPLVEKAYLDYMLRRIQTK